MTVAALEALREREGVEADRLAERAALLGRGALADSTLVAGRKAAAAALRPGEGVVQGPAHALMRLRGDPTFAPVFERDLRKAEALTRDLLLEAMRQGFLTDARGRGDATATDAKALRVSVTLDAADEAALAGYPIVGHSLSEWARHLVVLLRHGVDGALAAPLAGGVSPQGVPAALSEEARVHGDRVAAVVSEAYFAGCSAATRALAAALVGAPGTAGAA